MLLLIFFFFKQKTAYEFRISDWSSDVCSSDLLDDRVYARAGDTIYLFGGDGDDEYDDSVVTVEMPFADGGTPATFKSLTAIDASLDGEWQVSVAFDPQQPTEFVDLGILTGPTWQQMAAGAQGASTHFKFKLTQIGRAWCRERVCQYV